MVPKKYTARAKSCGAFAPGAKRAHVVAADRSVAIETHARAGIGSANDNDRTVLRRVLGFACEVICIARNDHEVKVPGLSECLTARGPIVFGRAAGYRRLLV